MNRKERPIANPVVVLRKEFDDWAVLFNPDTADAVGVNPVGVAVWESMDGKRNLEEIASEVKNNFDSTPPSVLDEISAFVKKLAEQGFVGYEL